MQFTTLFFLVAGLLCVVCAAFESNHPKNLQWRASEGTRVKRQWGGGYPGMYGGGGYPGMYGGGGYPGGGGYGGGFPMGGSYGSSSWGSYSSSKSGGFSSFNNGFYGR